MQDPLSLSVVLLPSVPPVRPLVLILTSLPRTFPSPLSETIPISVPSFQALAPSPALCFGLVSEVSCTAFREQLQEHRRKLARLAEEQEDVDIQREELEEKAVGLEEAVGLMRAL